MIFKKIHKVYPKIKNLWFLFTKHYFQGIYKGIFQKFQYNNIIFAKDSYIILLLFLNAFIVFGQNDLTIDIDNNILSIDIDSAVELALNNNLGIKSEKISLLGSKWKMIASWNTFIPNMSLNATMIRFNRDNDQKINQTIPTVPVYMGQYGTLSLAKNGDAIGYLSGTYEDTIEIPNWAVSAKFDLQFAFNAAMVFSVYQTVLDWQSGKLSLEKAQKQLNRDVKKNYYNLILLQQSIDLMKSNIESARKRYDQADVNYRNGLVPELTKLQAQIGYENMKPALVEMENGLKSALLAFKQMIGVKEDVELNLTSGIVNEYKESFDADKIIDTFISRKLELKSLEMQLEKMKNNRNMAIAALTPSFVLMFSADPTFQKNPIEDPWFDSADDWKQSSGMFGITLSLPLGAWFPFSREQINLTGANFGIQQLNLSIEQLKQGAELEIKSIVMKLKKSYESINALKLNVTLAEKTYSLLEQAYKSGQKPLIEVEDAEVELNKAKNNLLKEEYNYTTGLLDLEYAVNTSIDELLKLNNKSEE